MTEDSISRPDFENVRNETIAAVLVQNALLKRLHMRGLLGADDFDAMRAEVALGVQLLEQAGDTGRQVVADRVRRIVRSWLRPFPGAGAPPG